MTRIQEWVERRIEMYERLLDHETDAPTKLNLRTKLGELREVLEEIVLDNKED